MSDNTDSIHLLHDDDDDDDVLWIGPMWKEVQEVKFAGR